jgi:hypothetical protein
MKYIAFLVALVTSTSMMGQTKIKEQYLKADSLLQAGDTKGAYNLFKELKQQVETKDTLYNYVVWYYVSATTKLESDYRKKEDYTNSLNYGLEALDIIQGNKQFFDEKFAEREQWMTKNIIVSYFGLEKFDEAKKYKDKLYQEYTNKTLPKGIDGYFNFDFFRLNEKNIWGYEWYPEIPEDRFSSSFTKVVYYVYSTNPDGTDKDQLFRFHVLMFHQDSKDAKFDYLLEKQMETDKATVSGSYYKYTYAKDIDYKKLRNDIKEIVTKGIEPDSRRTILKN